MLYGSFGSGSVPYSGRECPEAPAVSELGGCTGGGKEPVMVTKATNLNWL